MGGHLSETVILLSAAVLAVSALRLVRLSPVLGYLLAGALVGPGGLALVGDIETVHALAEFGVVFLLFVIGLELSFARMIAMRRKVFGFGSAQMVLTTLAGAGVAYAFGVSTAAALIIGAGFALSSTAIVLEVLDASGEKSNQAGRLTLSALILQDLAIIPLLVLVPLLSQENASVPAAIAEAGIKGAIGVALMMAAGRILLRPLFRVLAAYAHRELFIATTLLIVLGMAWASTLVGLSPTLGAFMAGLLIAETEFRPQVEADIMPFKGLFLGLFFMTVGMNIDMRFVANNLLDVGLISVALIVIKTVVVVGLCRLFAFPLSTSITTGLLLAQGSELGFVLFALAGDQQLLSPELMQLLAAAITVTMIATPFLALLAAKISAKLDRGHLLRSSASTRANLDLKNHVLIAGYGRVGRTVARLLEAERIPYIALDMNAATVGKAREAGKAVYYGDAMRPIVLRALGIARAGAMIITYGDCRASEQAIYAVRSLRSDLPIVARARNIEEVQRLENAGAQLAVAEMFETSLQLGGALLKELSVPQTEIARIINAFRAEDYALTREAEIESDGKTDTKMSSNRHTPTSDFAI